MSGVQALAGIASAGLVAASLVLAAPASARDVINGTGGDDHLRGTAFSDTIRGFGGSDHVYALAGPDLIFGGSGFDRVQAGRGDDNIRGGLKLDEVDAGRGDDTIRGGNGEDALRGGPGADTIYGGAGPEFGISGGAGPDVIFGGAVWTSSSTAPGRTRSTPGMEATTSSWMGTELPTPCTADPAMMSCSVPHRVRTPLPPTVKRSMSSLTDGACRRECPAASRGHPLLASWSAEGWGPLRWGRWLVA